MATAISHFNDEKALLLDRLQDLEFLDDASEFECKRCGNLLINHYISNCGHTFCSNCRKLLGDGSGLWKCPQCQEFIKTIDLQNFDFEQKLFDLRVRCANHKYGCAFSCQLKELCEHLKTCKLTRENALPVIYKGPHNPEALLEQMVKFNQKFDKLNADIEAIEVKINKNQATFDNKLKKISNRVDDVNADLQVETTKINDILAKATKNNVIQEMTQSIDKNKSDIEDLSRKSDFWLKLLEMANKQTEEKLTDLKKDFSSKVDKLQVYQQTEYNAKILALEESNNKIMEEMDKNMIVIKQQICETSTQVEKSTLLVLETEEKIEQKIKQINKEIDEIKNNTTRLNKNLGETAEEVEKCNLTLIELEENTAKKLENEMMAKVNFELGKMNQNIIQQNVATKQDLTETKKRLLNLERVVETKLVQPPPVPPIQLQLPLILNRYLMTQNRCRIGFEKMNELISQENFNCPSNVFPLIEYSMFAQLKMESKTGGIWLSINFLGNPTAKQQLPFVCIPTVYYILRSQPKYGEAKDIQRSFTYPFDSAITSNVFNYQLLAFSKNVLTDAVYNANNSVVIDVFVESSADVNKAASGNGQMIWVLKDYQKNKQKEIENLALYQMSPYFYTSPRGYKMQVKTFLNGFGENKGTGLTFRVEFVTGLFDKELPKAFRHKTTVSVGKTAEAKQRSVKTETNEIPKKGWYLIHMGCHKELEALVENDTLDLNIVVEPI